MGRRRYGVRRSEQAQVRGVPPPYPHPPTCVTVLMPVWHVAGGDGHRLTQLGWLVHLQAQGIIWPAILFFA